MQRPAPLLGLLIEPRVHVPLARNRITRPTRYSSSGTPKGGVRHVPTEICFGSSPMTHTEKPTSAATYERAKRLADVSMFAVDLQVRRLRSTEPEDATFIFRKWFDFDSLVVALTRLRRAATLARKVPEIRRPVAAALREFDSSLPDFTRLRDVAEHIDEYAVDSGKRSSVPRQDLEVSSIDGSAPTLNWLGVQLNASEALVAAVDCTRLFRMRPRSCQSRSAGGSSALCRNACEQ